MTAPNRRLFRLSLRTLFVIVTVFACWLGWNLHQVREREALLASIRTRRIRVFNFTGHQHPALPISWRLLGAEAVTQFQGISMPGGEFAEDERENMRAHFPELLVR